MKRRPRIYYTEAQKSLMWARWQQGDSLHAIAALFDRKHGSVRGILLRTGGIRPRQRTRSRQALTWRNERRFRALLWRMNRSVR